MAKQDDDWGPPITASGVSAPVVPQGDDEWGPPITGSPQVATPVKQEYGPLAGAKMFGHSIASAAQSFLGLPADLASAAFSPDPNSAPWQKRVQNALTGLPSPTEIGQFTGLGLAQHPEFTPQNAKERFAVSAAEALPNAAAIVASGGASALPALITAETGAASAQAAREKFPESRWAPVVAGIVGSLGAGWATSGVQSWLASREATKDLAQRELELQAAREAKVTGAQEAERAADTLRNASAARLSATKATAKQVEDAAAGQTAQTFQATAGQLGTSSTLEEVGKTLQAHAREWLTKVMPQKMEAVAKPLDEAVPATTATPISNFAGAYSSIDKKRIIDQLDLPDTLNKRVKEVLGGAEEELTGEAGAPLTWAEARKLRTAIGDAMSRPKIVTDIGEQNINQLYAAATADLGKVAEAQGAGPQFQAFNQESTRLHQIQAGPMGKIISTKNAAQESITPGKAVKALVAGAKDDGTELAALRGEIPVAVDDLAAQQLRGGNWDKLSPEARVALVADPVHQQAIETAQAAETQARVNAKKMVDSAAEQHVSDLAAARTAAIAAKQSRANAVTTAKNALTEAASKVPPARDLTAEALDTIKKYAAVAGGYAGGPWVLNQLGIHVSPETGALFGAAALGAPLVGQGAKALAGNPGLASIPLTGAQAGGNALSIPVPRQGR